MKSYAAFCANPSATAQIILHVSMVAREIESEDAFLRYKNQSCLQIRPAFENVGRDFSDAESGVNVRPAKTLLHFLHGRQRVSFLARDALAEARRGFNRARH